MAIYKVKLASKGVPVALELKHVTDWGCDCVYEVSDNNQNVVYDRKIGGVAQVDGYSSD